MTRARLRAAGPRGRLAIGQGLKCDAAPYIQILDTGTALIGDLVTVRRDVELRISGRARLEIANGVKLDRGVRVIAANDAVVRVGEATAVGLGSVLNGGDSITIGRGCLISGYVYVQTSMHRHAAGIPIRHQGYDHEPVVLGDDVWLGAHAVVLPGSHLADGTVVGSNAVIRATTQPGEVWAGVPAHKIGERAPGE